jgi:hypothetical protein
MSTPEELVASLEQFLNETRADVIALDTILKVIITRSLPPGEEKQFLDEVEQQCLHSIECYEARQQLQVRPRIENFLSALRQWQKDQTRIVSVETKQ